MSNQDLHISKSKPCHHCEGRGYISIRDCSGEIQREENCSFCEGAGQHPQDHRNFPSNIPKITEIFPATKSR